MIRFRPFAEPRKQRRSGNDQTKMDNVRLAENPALYFLAFCDHSAADSDVVDNGFRERIGGHGNKKVCKSSCAIPFGQFNGNIDLRLPCRCSLMVCGADESPP